MEVLAKEDKRFKGIDNPIPCSKKCEEVFQAPSSSVQLVASNVHKTDHVAGTAGM